MLRPAAGVDAGCCGGGAATDGAAESVGSPRLVIYTGAGVSTSTGIGDYRGPKGVWTNLAEGIIPDETFGQCTTPALTR